MNIRCWKCGSKNVTVSLSTESKYSIGKGTVGTLLFGTGGAAMGVNGKTSESKRYICQACGEIASFTLSENTCAEIEKALKENDASTLQLKKRLYPNIEWEPSVTVPAAEPESVKADIREYSYDEIKKMVYDFFMDPTHIGKSFSDSEILTLLGLNDNYREELREQINDFVLDLVLAEAGSFIIDVDEEKYLSSLKDDLNADIRYTYSPEGNDCIRYLNFKSRVSDERKRIKKEREEAEQQQKAYIHNQKRKIADAHKASRIAELAPYRKKLEAALDCFTSFYSFSNAKRRYEAFLLLNGEVIDRFKNHFGLHDIIKLSGEWALDINGKWRWIREYTNDDITQFKELAEKAREEFNKCGDVKQIYTSCDIDDNIYFIAVRENGEMLVFGSDSEFDYLKEWKNIEKYCFYGVAIRKSGDLALAKDFHDPSVKKWNECYDIPEEEYTAKVHYAVNLDGTLESVSLDIKHPLEQLQYSGEIIQVVFDGSHTAIITKNGNVITNDKEICNTKVIAGKYIKPYFVFVTEDGQLIQENGKIHVEGIKLWDNIETIEEDRRQAIKKEQEKRRLEEIRIEEEERKKAEEKRRAGLRAQKLCQHCGGIFKGFFSKTCTACGKTKDY